MVAIAIVVVLVTGAVVAPALMSGRPLFGASDSMAIFDRPQTERDLQYPDGIRRPGPRRRLGSATWDRDDGHDVYVYKCRRVASPVQEIFDLHARHEWGRCDGGIACTPGQFSLGIDISQRIRRRVDRGAVGHPRQCRSNDGAEHPPIRFQPLTVFDEEQDDADLNALAYLPDIPPSQQDTVRFLGSSAGYFAAAYRDADDAVCLAVYEGGTTLATSESTCVSEAEFEDAGIQLSFPTAAPEISVTWGPGPGLAFSGR